MTGKSGFDSHAFLSQTPDSPGVYRMYDQQQQVIYVGKAKSLHKRLSSYFRKNVDSAKTRALVNNIASIELTVTHTETEALLLEHNLIKKYRPRYNVIFRDDKTYPYILLSEHSHPRLSKHRGAKKQKGEYFGPYPSGSAVNASLHLMQKLFPIRQCSDSEYANRQRPCLQYQLKRCSGPCVEGLVSNEDYAQQVNLARMFLKGKSAAVIQQLVDAMQQASSALAFEKAAKLRDQIQAMRTVQEQQWVSGGALHSDVIGFAYHNGLAAIHLLMIRDGNVLGSRAYFPKMPANTTPQELLRSFVLQYYLAKDRQLNQVDEILLPLEDDDWLTFTQALNQANQTKVKLLAPKRGDKSRYIALANTNAENALQQKLHQKQTIEQRYAALEQVLPVSAIQRMECFDISHTMGERTVASCVVFNRDGPFKSDYRRFNIEGIQGGDDYAAMEQALERRYSKVQVENLPDVLFIDGGKGQLNRALAVIDRLDLAGRMLVVGVAKGISRKPGLETLLIGSADNQQHLASDSVALHLIQHIRDESHRFAITGHRQRRQKARTQSVLQDIPGVGTKRRQAILSHLGGLQQVEKASVDELAKIPGISKALAQKIYDTLHH